MMKNRKRMMGLLTAMVIAVAIPSYSQAAPVSMENQKENIVVVLDPGHGGKAAGGQIPGLDEKNMNFITACSMKEELEKYEGITVYMTRYDDTNLSLAQRAQVAANLQADFLFSIHYNKSAAGNLYGAEVWIPSLGEGYSKGYACGDMILNELCDNYGIYRRGIKTKLNDKGTDYYGVIRNAAALGVPSMIIEHCHMDHIEDVPFYNSIEKLQQLGRLDATGVAKYLGLKSQLLGVDYSTVQTAKIAVPILPVIQDMTPPETSVIVSAKAENGQIKAVLQGKDSQSPILYYDYSLDGGITWSSLRKWESAGQENTVTIPGKSKSLTIRVYNQYDLATQSATVSVS